MINRFKFFANKVLPLVYDDSLSYYEVLAKLTGKVNEVIENINNNLEEYIRENLPEIYADTVYDSETNTIMFSDDPDPTYSGDGVEQFQVGDKLIKSIDAYARNLIDTANNNISDLDTALATLTGRVNAYGLTIGEHTAQIGQANILNLAGKNIVFIGDSWTVGGSASQQSYRFSSRVAASLGMIEKNFGIGGAGFLMASKFSDQIASANLNMTSAEKENTSVVVVCGGVNDVRYLDQFTLSEFTSTIDADLTSIHTIFPNALIIAVIGNTLCHGMTETMIHWLTSGQETAQLRKNFPVLVCRGCENWVRNQEIRYITDGLHLSDTGHSVWASFIVNAIAGGSNYVQDWIQTMQLETGVSAIVYPHVWKENGLIKVSSGRLQFAESITENTLIGHVNATCAPKENVYVPIYTANQLAGSVGISAAGGVYLNPLTNPISACYFPGCDWIMY